MRISWKKQKQTKILQKYISPQFEKWGFYFDKNDVLILPEQVVKIPIWFKTEVCGTCSETWEILMEPNLYSDTFHLFLILFSYSYFRDKKEKIDHIVRYIDGQVKNNLIKDILNEIVSAVKYTEKEVVSCGYEEWQLFEIANSSNNRLLYLFDKNIVDELKEFYEKVQSNGTAWNYSVKYLKQLAEAKDVTIYLENKNQEVAEKILAIQTNKTEEAEQVIKKEPSKPKTKVNKKSPRKNKKAVSNSSEEHAEVTPLSEPVVWKENYIQTNQLELSNIVKKLDSPGIINREREKYFLCSKVMTACFSKMCHRLSILDKEYHILKEETVYPEFKYKLTPINELPDRLIYEYYENDYLSNKPKEHYFGAKRKPKILRDIPSDDVETIYKLYFQVNTNEAEPDPTIKKKGKGKDRASKKKNKEKVNKKDKKSKDKKSKEKEKSAKNSSKSAEKLRVESELSIESFNPHAEEFNYVQESEEKLLVESNTRMVKKLRLDEYRTMEDYKYEQYVTVYTSLCDAVDAIVDTLHTFECTIPHSTLNQMKNRFPDSFSEIKQK